jgi:hypothetical protein
LCARGKSVRMSRRNFFHKCQSHISLQLLLRGALAEDLGYVEIYKIGMMKND